MIERKRTDPRGEFQARPLCSSYFLAIHESLAVQVRDGDRVRGEVVRWALGVLADGSYEVIGVWAAPASASWYWQDAVVDLRARGVKNIGLVSELGRGSSNATPRRRLRTLHASEEVMRQLQRRACRAIKRRGPCSDIAEAAAFVEDVLARAELGTGAVGESVEIAFESLAGAEPTRSRTNTAKMAALGR